jgi:predicted phage terminase large subunit-like protein
MSLSPKEETELLRLLELEQIDRAWENFYSFCVWMDPKFFTPGKPHLKQIAEAFQEVAEGKIKKLMISMPPRAGKSYETSLFCAWMIGRQPEGSIMRNSYAAELAEKFSYDIRQIVQMDKYLAVFPHVKLKQDKKAVNDWAITKAKQTTYFCAGVGGAITGKGCTLAAILDDPIKNIEEALSETVIEKVWNWYTSTHLSRLETGCPEIHIATRWSRKDPIGRLLEDYGDDWTVIVIPALTDSGETFCEEIKTTAELLAIKKVNEDFIWEAEYMQNPIEAKGLLYPIEQLKRFTVVDLATKKPDGIIGFTDTADRGDDYLCSVTGKRYGDYTYITDVVFTQDGVEITEPLVAQKIIDTKEDIEIIEANNGGASFCRNVRKLVKPKWKCSVIDQHETTNKETRILMNAGYVKEYFYFRSDYEPGSDYDKFMRALTSYVKIGKNKHDDAPDGVTGLAIRMKAMPTKKPAPEPEHYNFECEKPKPRADSATVTESFFTGGWS